MTVADCGSEASLVWDSIQPHGALLVLQGLELRVVRASANASDLVGLPSVLERNAADCFAESAASFLQELTDLTTGQFRMGDLTSLAGEPLYATAHRPLDSSESSEGASGATLILEVEPLASERHTLPASERATLYAALVSLRRALGPEALLQAATAELQQLTQYERVLAYRFDVTGAGEVVAESLGSTASESYLGLHYPASDIPPAARAAYQHCFLRYIPDFSAPAVPLIASETTASETTASEAESAEPVLADSLNLALLRHPSPCCIEYHHNMGVEALLVLPLLQAGELWGLLACHHNSPRPLDPAIRADCELFGQFVALELANHQTRSERAYEEYLQALRSQAIAALVRTQDLHGTLLSPEFRLLGLTEAAGAAVCLDGKISLLGATPSRSHVRALLTWTENYLGEDESLLATHTLSALYPAAVEFADTASGLLLLQISRTPRWSILWFRPEIPRTIVWAGNPSADKDPDAAKPLGPRASFARWQDINRSTAKPWQPAELRSARELRNAIVGLVLHKLDDLERSNQELASFAFAASHDLKEPLRGIHNYAAFLLEDYADRLDETGRDRLQVLMRLSQRMENLIDVLLRYSRLGQTELNAEPIDLEVLVNREIELFQLSRPQDELEFRQPRPLPTLSCDPVLIRELFNNLIGNAYKYNDKARRWVEIGYLTPAEQIRQFPKQPLRHPVLLYVRDNGIGIRDRHQQTIFRLFKRLHARDRYGGGTGAGLAIAKRIVERHNGELWVDSTYGSGSTFYFYLNAGTLK